MKNIDFDALFPEKAKVLMVDDTPANLDILRETLGPEGYNIYAAPRGDIAIRIAEQAIPDLILLDVMMPGMDGYETCEKLKESDVTQDIPVIFISAKNDAHDVVKGFEVGGVDYIFKPFKQA
jgi:CheY-like chemotaxis protein